MTNLFQKDTHHWVIFKKVNECPNREPDYVSYSKIKHRHYFTDSDDLCKNYDGILEYNLMDSNCDYYNLVYILKKSSEYWYTEKGIYRKSDHWGQCGKSVFELDNNNSLSIDYQIGYCDWSDFKSVDEYWHKRMELITKENLKKQPLQGEQLLSSLQFAGLI
ncbi:MAG TPA: hypothetical protein PKD51_10045 [Saprospiraceae bacterium]|nr:hypothetical protein [Saprospiraceae bacterium]